MPKFCSMKYGLYIRARFRETFPGYRFLSYPEIRNLALLAEEYGFDSVHIDDHLIGFGSLWKEPYFETAVLVSAIATETTKVKIGNNVLANSFRNPALMAKIISSVDNISNGRALFWIGAGWYEEEYRAYGYAFPSAKQRVDELEEALTIFKKLFTEEVTNFEGKFWKLENCRNFPKPIQKPWPQIVVGAEKNRLTTIACREADGINIPYGWAYGPPIGFDALEERIGFIRSKLHKYNRNSEEFEISICNDVILVNSKEELDKIVSQMIEHFEKLNKRLTKEQILKNYLIGYVEDVKEKVEQIEEFGIKKMMIYLRGSSSIEDPVKLFHDGIM